MLKKFQILSSHSPQTSKLRFFKVRRSNSSSRRSSCIETLRTKKKNHSLSNPDLYSFDTNCPYFLRTDCADYNFFHPQDRQRQFTKYPHRPPEIFPQNFIPPQISFETFFFCGPFCFWWSAPQGRIAQLWPCSEGHSWGHLGPQWMGSLAWT